MNPFDVLIRNTSEVVTCDGPLAGPAEATLGAIPAGAIGLTGERVAWLGPESELPKDAISPSTKVVDAHGQFVGPGFVDPHTHLVFAGDRAAEFEMRCQGKTYVEIAQAGGGIVSTVKATRAAREETLVELALPRLVRLLAQGVTTVEIKSGYGLDVIAELAMLRAIRRLGEVQPVSVVPTFMGLHSLPKEYANDREAYFKLCVDVMLPQVSQEHLARFADVFVEGIAFTPDEARRFAMRAKGAGLKLLLHVDQLTSGQGAELAAELGAVAAAHLERATPEGIAALAKSKTVALLAPISTLFARAKPYAPGRALRDAGVPVALCTNVNPGSSNSENVSLAMGLACLENGLTPAEAFLGFTRVAGLALADPSLGRLTVGGPADLVVHGTASYRFLPYHLGMNDVRLVVKAGRVFDFAGSPRSR